jgi:hypothetical protein
VGRENQFEAGDLVRRRVHASGPIHGVAYGVVIGPTDRDRLVWALLGAVDVMFGGQVFSYHPGNLIRISGGDISPAAV